MQALNHRNLVTIYYNVRYAINMHFYIHCIKDVKAAKSFVH